eukprot:7991625-Pyramimonas_sp.AAC.1
MVLAASPLRSCAAAFPCSSTCSPEALAGTRGRSARTAVALEEIAGKQGGQICSEAGPQRGGLGTHARLPGVLPQAGLLGSAPPAEGQVPAKHARHRRPE